MEQCNKNTTYFFWMLFVGLLLCLVMVDSYAAETLGKAAMNMKTSIAEVAKLIGVGCYVGGLGFAIGSIMKFKQHKDNPTQIPVGTPIALVFVAAALLFLPSVMKTLGATMFSGGAKVAGTAGTWGSLGGGS